MDFFTHAEIAGVLSDISPFQRFLLNFFSQGHYSEDEKIYFDRIQEDLRVSIFQGPNRPATVTKQRGFSVEAYEPGYIKDKITVSAKQVIKRRPGQPLSAAMSAEEKFAAIIAQEAQNMLTRFYRRLELMAAQLLIAGSYSMVGEDVNVTVDQERLPANTITKSGGTAWKSVNTAVSPINDIEDAMETAKGVIKTIVMGKLAWAQVKKDPMFEKLIYIDALKGQSNGLLFGPQAKDLSMPEGLIYRGTLGGADIYTYTETYTHPDTGVETLFIPGDGVLLLPDATYGWQCFGLIEDADSNYTTTEYFFKNWVEKDPGIPYLMMQSAPMLLHTKINATVYIGTGANGT